MRAGKLDRQITIQFPAVSRDTLGGQVLSWADYATVWARVDLQPNKRTEAFTAAQVVANAEVLFSTRYLAGVLETFRVLYDNHVYDIKGVTETGRKQGLEIRGKQT